MDKINRVSYDGRSVTVGDFHSPNSTRTIRTSVIHAAGRGNKVSFQLCDIERSNGYSLVTFTIFQDPGKSYLVDGQTRFNRKHLFNVAADSRLITEHLELFTQSYKLGNDWA